MALFTALLVGVPIGIRLYGLNDPNPIATAFAVALLATVMWFVGGLLGSAVASLMGTVHLRLIPGYRHRLLSVAVVLGLCTWSLVPLLYMSGGFDPAPIPWLRWTPLWSYGLLGLGFVSGFCVPDISSASGVLLPSRFSLSRTVPFGIAWMMPVAVATMDSFRLWLNDPFDSAWPGLTPLAMLCLLVGPLSWPAMVSLFTAARQDSPVVRRDWQSLLRSGEGNAWNLSAVASRLHAAGHLRIEFLVFQPALLSLWATTWVLLLVVAVLLLFALGSGFGGVDDLRKMNLSPALVGALSIPLIPIQGGPIDVQRLGQTLLLPGQFNRSTLPGRVFTRLLLVWVGGVLIAMAPVAAIAFWYGASAIKIGLFALLLLWGICCAAAAAFYRAPGAQKKAGFNPWDLFISALLLIAFLIAKEALFDVYSVELCLSVVALAFVAPLALYRFGLRRWRTMEYGA